MVTSKQLDAIENSGIEGRGVTRDGGIIVEIPSARIGDFLAWLQGIDGVAPNE